MKHVKKSVLLWYSAHEIYELVIDVESYPKFLPWCERAEILERDADGLTARLHLAYSGMRHAFTTRNVQVRGRVGALSLVDGPFSQLDGLWRFVPLPRAGRGGQSRRRPAPARSSSRCATPSPTACSTRRSARCSTGSPTPSSIPSCAAPSRSMDRASGARRVLRVAVAWSARPGEACEVGVELCAGRQRARCDPRQRRAGAATQRSTSRPRRSASGAGPRRSMRRSPRATGSRSTGRWQMDPKEARRLRARAPESGQRNAARYFGQSAAITSLACLVSSARCLSSRNSRSPFSLVRVTRMPLSKRAQLRPRAAAVVGLGGGDAVFLGLVLGRDLALGLLALGLELGIDLRRGAERPPRRRGAPKPRRGGGGAAAAAAARRRSAGTGCPGRGCPTGGGRSLYWMRPPLSFHFHCASAGRENEHEHGERRRPWPCGRRCRRTMRIGARVIATGARVYRRRTGFAGLPTPCANRYFATASV